MDLGRSVRVRTYGFIHKQNWRLHWGSNCFLVSLVSLALIACFMISESVGDPSRLFGFEISLKNLSFFKFCVYRHSRTVPFSHLRESSKFAPYCVVQCEQLAVNLCLACENPWFSHCNILLACELVCESFWDWILSFLMPSFALNSWMEILEPILICLQSTWHLLSCF